MWQPRQLAELPLVLCGPLLRLVEPSSVTVFAALKEPRKVTLRVYAQDSGATGSDQRMEGTRSTIALADHIHVVAVTATGQALASGTLYRYQLFFGAHGGDGTAVAESEPTVFSDGVVHADGAKAKERLVYPGAGRPTLPSFATPPDDPGRLRLLHGSCRKPHGGGRDMLPVVDDLIRAGGADALERPHQLMLTGDQIYADDVADPLLALIQANAKTLGARPETLPNRKGSGLLTEASQKIGLRQELLRKEAQFTSGQAKSHLLYLAEFTGMYLLAWSDALWPQALPEFGDVFTEEKRKLGATYDDIVAGRSFDAVVLPDVVKRVRRWLDETTRLEGFLVDLPAVRRALANVPVLMILDDHEVTDDWFLNRRWCEEAALLDGDKGSALGRRIVLDGLLAYVLFQGWGNRPADFAPAGAAGAGGRELLARIASWDGKEGDDAGWMRQRLGIPSGFDDDGQPQRAAGAVDHHYVVRWTNYQLYVLDTRTRRGFPGGREDPPALVYDGAALALMLDGAGDLGASAATVVVSAAPVVGLPLLEEFLQPILGASYGGAAFADAEAWGLQDKGLYALLPRVLRTSPKDADGIHRRRLVMLSGDVHFGYGARLRYSAKTPFAAPHTPDGGGEPVEGVMAQFVSSALLNQEGLTEALHCLGFRNSERLHLRGALPFINVLPHRDFVGWTNGPKGDAIQVGVDLTGGFSGATLIPWRISGTPAVDEVTEDRLLTAMPEWRCDVTYLMHDEEDPVAEPRPDGVRPVDAPTADRKQALAQYLNASRNHRDYMGKWGSGKELVGMANLGEIGFAWGEGEAKKASQTLWWRLPGQVDPAPLTRVVADLAIGTSLFEPPLYGGFVLQEGDKDATSAAAPVYGGVERKGYTGAKQVDQLQRDLLELGIRFVAQPTGTFDRLTRWAVRELQGHAAGSRVAHDTAPQPAPERHVLALESVPVAEDERYPGVVHGQVDLPTQATIRRWKDRKWRCPVVVEAWHTTDGEPTEILQIPAAGGQPARTADNVWRFDEVTDQTATLFASDLSGRLAGGAAPPSPPPRVPLAGYDPHAAASGWGGPLADARKRHTARVAEALPEQLLPSPAGGIGGPSLAGLVADRSSVDPDVAALAGRRLSTFKVLRAVAEAREAAFLDAVRADDERTLTFGLGGWSAGMATPPTEITPPDKPVREWKVAAGELGAFVAYLRRFDVDAYEALGGAWGLAADKGWGADGKSLLDDSHRVMAARLTLTDVAGQAKALDDVAEHDLLRSWPWITRVVGAVREVDAVRRRMWPFARQRIADVLWAPWDPPDGPKTVADVTEGATARPARLGDVLASELTVALVLAWHHLRPADMVGPGPESAAPPVGPTAEELERKRKLPRAGPRLQAVLTRAKAAAGAPSFDGAPTAWADVHETALAAALSAEAAGDPVLAATLAAVTAWPAWTNSPGDAVTAVNPRGFALPLTALPAAERTLARARSSLHFDDSQLPRKPA